MLFSNISGFDLYFFFFSGCWYKCRLSKVYSLHSGCICSVCPSSLSAAWKMTSLTYEVNKRNVLSLRLARVCLWIVGIKVMEQIRRSEHSPRINSNYKLPPFKFSTSYVMEPWRLTFGACVIFKHVLCVSTLGKVALQSKLCCCFFCCSSWKPNLDKWLVK